MSDWLSSAYFIPLALTAFPLLGILAALAVHPSRKKLVRLGEALLAEDHWDEGNREEVNQLLDGCMSFRVGVVMPFAVVGVLADAVLGRLKKPHTAEKQLTHDPRFREMLSRYLVSVLAANLPFAVISLPLLLLLLGGSEIFRSRGARDLREIPILRASAIRMAR